MSSPGRYGSWRGTLVSYAIIAAVSGTGSLVTPFVKAIGQTLL